MLRNASTLFLVAYLLRVCLPSHSLATGAHVTIIFVLLFHRHKILQLTYLDQLFMRSLWWLRELSAVYISFLFLGNHKLCLYNILLP
jgi:hypothetical protein